MKKNRTPVKKRKKRKPTTNNKKNKTNKLKLYNVLRNTHTHTTAIQLENRCPKMGKIRVNPQPAQYDFNYSKTNTEIIIKI